MTDTTMSIGEIVVDTQKWERHCGAMKPTLRALIDDRGLRQDWLASKLVVPRSAFSKYVSGRLRFPVVLVQPFADLLQVDVATVVDAIEQTRLSSETVNQPE